MSSNAIQKPVILNDGHIIHKSGRVKTVCVTACLTALGVPIDSFHYTGTLLDNTRENILRRNGYSVRSRKSKIPKRCTIGRARLAIKDLKDPVGTNYLIIVKNASIHPKGYHCVLLDQRGFTIVDTAPVKRDQRKIISIKAVFKK